MELLRTPRLLLRNWEESDLPAFFDIYSREDVARWLGLATESARALLRAAADAGMDEVLALTDLDNAPSQAVATRLGMHDDGVTDRWFRLTLRQYRRVL